MQSNFFLVFIITIFSLCNLNSQWLAQNYNSANYSNAIIINGLPQPQSSSDYANLAYDFFVIFKNGKHYNSRYLNTSPFVGNGSSPFQLNFQNQTYVPDYVGLTKKYPPSISLPTGNIITPSEITNYNSSNYEHVTLNYSSPQEITSDHDIVPGEDITLIIPNLPCSNQNSEFDSLKIIYPNFLHPKSMYQNSLNSAGCIWNTQNTLYTIVNNSISLDITNYSYPYIYITFNCNENIELIGGQAAFDIKYCNQSSIIFSQHIGPTHDPNFLKLNCIKYDIPHKAFCANYTLQFFNDGIVALEKAKAKFILLPDMIKSSLKLHSWQFGEEVGTEYAQNEFTKSFSNDTVVFNFFKGQLIPFRNPHLIPSSPYLAIVNFSIRFKSGVDISDINYNLKPQTPKTDFLPGIYDIPLFFDIQAETCHYEKKKKYRPTNKQCKCY